MFSNILNKIINVNFLNKNHEFPWESYNEIHILNIKQERFMFSK